MKDQTDDLPRFRTNDELGKIFRDRRKELGITQWQVAEKLGTRQQVIAHIENGIAKRTVFAAEICKLLNLNLDTTLFDTNERSSYVNESDYENLTKVFVNTLSVLASYNELQDKPFIPPDDIQSTADILIKKLRKHMEKTA